MPTKWHKQLRFTIEWNWPPKLQAHWDYGEWYKNGRHNVLLNAWLGFGLTFNVSIGRFKR